MQNAGISLDKQAVNIGAGTGIEQWDPVAELHLKYGMYLPRRYHRIIDVGYIGFGGIAIECDDKTYEQLVHNVPFDHVVKVPPVLQRILLMKFR